jgi:Fe-S-cluster containining protein
MSDPAICARCAAKQHTCCHISPGSEENCFPLSLDERERLKPYLPAGTESGAMAYPNTNGFLRLLHRMFPGERQQLQALFPEHQSHHHLALTTDGHCVFLGKQGCMVPRAARPHYCRLYPFWYVHDQLFIFATNSCLAVCQANRPERLCVLLDTNPPALRGHYTALRSAWGLDT